MKAAQKIKKLFHDFTQQKYDVNISQHNYRSTIMLQWTRKPLLSEIKQKKIRSVSNQLVMQIMLMLTQVRETHLTSSSLFYLLGIDSYPLALQHDIRGRYCTSIYLYLHVFSNFTCCAFHAVLKWPTIHFNKMHETIYWSWVFFSITMWRNQANRM